MDSGMKKMDPEGGRVARGRAGSVAAASSAGPAKTRKSTSLPSETVEYLKAWMMSPEHIAHPYPTEQEKAQIMDDTGIELKQLTNWFVNNRKRYWKPRVEARLQEQAQAAASAAATYLKPPTSKPQPVPVSPAVTRLTASLLGTVITASNLILDSPAPPTAEVVTIPEAISNMPRSVSEHSSLASSSENTSVASAEPEDQSAGQSTDVVLDTTVTKTESVSVRILRSLGGGQPSLEDVTILPNIPDERVLRSYDNCVLTYRYAASDSGDSKKVLSRRDAEIVRMKKHYLKLFLAESGGSVSVPPSQRKRPSQIEIQTPRPKFRRVSVDLWKEACRAADTVYDDALPSLEEATHLFGFTN